MPVLVELIMLIGDKAGVKYTSGLEEGTEMRSTLIDLAVSKFNSEDDKEEVEVENKEEEVEEPLVSGLMSRNN